MALYFAFGSNMHRARLQARVGEVVDLGWATLDDHDHAFSMRGGDGTGKGNIVPCYGARVHGVLYELTPRQLEVLHRYEGGYRLTELEVLHQARVRRHVSASYVALREVPGLLPADWYLRHYERGMEEHGLPLTYCDLILRQARGLF